MKLNNPLQKIQNTHLTIESMITLGLIGFFIILSLVIIIIPKEQPEIETPGDINLALPKSMKDPIVYTETLLPKVSNSKS